MQLPPLNIETLTTFITVCDCGSINKASESLLISQPAISKKITHLEELVNHQLLTRTSQGVSLTDDGKEFYSKARKIVTEIQNLFYFSSDKSIPPLNSVRAGTLDSIATAFAPHQLLRIISEAQKYVSTNKIYELITPFNQEQLDVIFMDEAFGNQLHGQIFSNTLYEEPYYVVGQTNVLQSIPTSTVTPNDLQQLQLLMYPQYCPIHSRVVQIFGKLGLSLPEIHEIDYSEALIKLITTSKFVTILPESLMRKNVSTIKNLDAKKLSIDFIRKVAVFSRNPQLTFQFKSMLQKI